VKFPQITALSGILALIGMHANFAQAQDKAEPNPSAASAETSPAGDAAASPGASAKPTEKHIAVVNFTKLFPFLPEPPSGWKADKPEGSTTESEGFSLTTAGRTYVQGEAENAPIVTINIIDAGNNKQFFDATTMMWSSTSETPEGYTKTLTIDSNRGFEQFTKDGQIGNLWVIVGARFFVQVETTNLPAAEMQNWLKKVDLKKLSALK